MLLWRGALFSFDCGECDIKNQQTIALIIAHYAALPHPESRSSERNESLETTPRLSPGSLLQHQGRGSLDVKAAWARSGQAFYHGDEKTQGSQQARGPGVWQRVHRCVCSFNYDLFLKETKKKPSPSLGLTENPF